mmetsp:Transcript_28079/g.66299  ORF Transcript_28079/g.66299 Transcript_28079/m.66299 type:complete len:341 (-) Transcript_28079:130-1152(-)
MVEVGHAGATCGAELRNLHRHRCFAGAGRWRRPPLHQQRGGAAGGAHEAAHLPHDHRLGHRWDPRHGALRLAGGLRQLARHALYGCAGAVLQPAEPALLRGAQPHVGARLPALVADEDAVHRAVLRHLPEGEAALEPVAVPRAALMRRGLGAGWRRRERVGELARDRRRAGVQCALGLRQRLPRETDQAARHHDLGAQRAARALRHPAVRLSLAGRSGPHQLARLVSGLWASGVGCGCAQGARRTTGRCCRQVCRQHPQDVRHRAGHYAHLRLHALFDHAPLRSGRGCRAAVAAAVQRQNRRQTRRLLSSGEQQGSRQVSAGRLRQGSRLWTALPKSQAT